MIARHARRRPNGSAAPVGFLPMPKRPHERVEPVGDADQRARRRRVGSVSPALRGR